MGRGWGVFANVLDAVDFDDDGGPAGIGGKFLEDFGFGLRPIFRVMARDFAVAVIDFLGAAADEFVEVERAIRAHEYMISAQAAGKMNSIARKDTEEG